MSLSSATACVDHVSVTHSPNLRTPNRFHCYLDDQPNFLVPSRLCNFPCGDPARLTLNRHCWWSGHEMGDASARLALRLESDQEIWVADNIRGAWLPFSVGPRYASILSALFSGTLQPAAIDENAIRVLRLARILQDPDQEASAHGRWSAIIARCAAEYADVGYASVADLLHPFHLGELRRYFRHCVRTGAFVLGDGQSPLRYAAHNEPVARFFHAQLTSVVSLIAGEPLKPSYVYFAAYCGGAELPCHTDRLQCAHSVTLLLDYAPEPEAESPWPLHLHTPRGLTSVYQSIGDGLMYRGQVIPHERYKLYENASSASFFFHYVNENFSGSLD
jgi:hypothetical protein